MNDANTILQLRQLISSELAGNQCSTPYGIWVETGGKAALVIWEFPSTDLEPFIGRAHQDATENGWRWRQTLIMSTAQTPLKQKEALAEALYVYGQAPLEDKSQPDTILISFNAPKHTGQLPTEVIPADQVPVDLGDLMSKAEALSFQHSQLTIPPPTGELLILKDSNGVYGAAELRHTDLSTRIAGYWLRGTTSAELHSQLIAACFSHGQQQGGLFLQAWVSQYGQLRYPLSEVGFESVFRVLNLLGDVEI